MNCVIKPILKRVSRYEGGTEVEDVVPPRPGHPFDAWDTKLRFDLTPEQAAKSENDNYRKYYVERKMRRRAKKRLGAGIWGKLREEDKLLEVEEEKAMRRRRAEEEDDDDDDIDWKALGYESYTAEEWEKMEMEKNGGKAKVEEKKEERVYTGITITEFNPVVEHFRKEWMRVAQLEIKIEGACGGVWGRG